MAAGSFRRSIASQVCTAPSRGWCRAGVPLETGVPSVSSLRVSPVRAARSGRDPRAGARSGAPAGIGVDGVRVWGIAAIPGSAPDRSGGLWAAWPAVQGVLAFDRGWNEIIFKVSASPNHSVIPWLLQSISISWARWSHEVRWDSSWGKKWTFCGVLPCLFSKAPLTPLRFLFYCTVHNSYKSLLFFYLGWN